MKKIKYRDIQNHLRRYRKLKGLTQTEVAKILGFKTSDRISLWERGICLPNLINCIKLAALYNTMIDALYMDFVREMRAEMFRKTQKQMSSRSIANGSEDTWKRDII